MFEYREVELTAGDTADRLTRSKTEAGWTLWMTTKMLDGTVLRLTFRRPVDE